MLCHKIYTYMHNFAGNLICTSIGVGYIIQTLFIVQNIWYSPNPIDELIFFKMVELKPPTRKAFLLGQGCDDTVLRR
jgi:hypothetical protein